jgi:large subunit ribosomal protein L18
MATINRKKIRERIHLRIRRKVSGTPERPRLAVHFSNLNVYAQLIDDTRGITLCAASTMEKDSGLRRSTVATATSVGELLADRAQAQGVSAVVFDRGGHIYHGKVKALADAARAKGLKF